MRNVLSVLFKFVLKVSIGTFVVYLVLFLAISYENKDKPKKAPYDYICDRPLDIPDTMRGGTKVYWDCDWQASYNMGNVKVLRDSLGRVTSVGRSIM